MTIIISDWRAQKSCEMNTDRDEASGCTEDLRYFPSVSINHHWTILLPLENIISQIILLLT